MKKNIINLFCCGLLWLCAAGAFAQNLTLSTGATASDVQFAYEGDNLYSMNFTLENTDPNLLYFPVFEFKEHKNNGSAAAKRISPSCKALSGISPGLPLSFPKNDPWISIVWDLEKEDTMPVLMQGDMYVDIYTLDKEVKNGTKEEQEEHKAFLRFLETSSKIDKKIEALQKKLEDRLAKGKSVKRLERKIARLNGARVKVYNHYRKENDFPQALKDKNGNPISPDYDLIRDNAFKKEAQVLVLQLYTGEQFDFAVPQAALESKGFTVKTYLNEPPKASKFEKDLSESAVLMVISDTKEKLTTEHIALIKKFHDSGKGVFILGENAPFYIDANRLLRSLVGKDIAIAGDIRGDRVLTVAKNGGTGIATRHDVTTGITNLYEGVTVAVLEKNGDLISAAKAPAAIPGLTPLLFTEQGVVAFALERDGKRLIVDGGYTKLFRKWDTAGTARYVKNAAGWLVNVERFAFKAAK